MARRGRKLSGKGGAVKKIRRLKKRGPPISEKGKVDRKWLIGPSEMDGPDRAARMLNRTVDP